MHPIAVNAHDFEQVVLKSDIPVIVDFWAPWCAPCRIIAPVLEQIAQEYAGRVKVVKLNTDENPEIAAKYNIRGIPTLLIFRNGEVVDQLVGAVPKHMITGKLDYYTAAVNTLN